MNPISTIGVAFGSPLYQVVKRRITESLRNEEWKPGEMIPPEKTLAERFGVSVGTLRKAVDELVAKNMLVRLQGRGTFVSAHNEDRYLYSFFHVTRHDGHKDYPQTELLEFARIKADGDVAAKLGGPPGMRVYRFVNKLALGGGPVIVDEIYLPEALFLGLTERRLRDRETTLYQFYQDQFAVTVVRTEDHLRAVKAGPLQARVLKVEEGDPMLKLIRVARSFRDLPVELRYSCIDTKHYEYFAENVGQT